MSMVMGLALILVLLLISAWAAIAATAVGRVGRAKAYHLEQDGRRGAKALVAIVEDPAPYLNVVTLLMVLTHVGAATVAVVLANDSMGGGGIALAAGLVTILFFVLAEVVPRTYAVQRTDRAALLVARPLRFIGRALKPLSGILIGVSNLALLVLPGRGMPKGPFVTEDEIRHLVDVAEEEEEIEEEERELIHSVFEFGDTIVREVMVPRPDMITIKGSATLDEALSVIIDAGFSRVPIYENDNDNIVGVLYAKDLMKRLHEESGGARVNSLGRAPTFVPEQKKVSELLRDMQEQRVHMAIVVDEYGGTAGLVTIEDLIEEIVGEIVDEYDQEEPLVEPIDDNTIRVDAKMPIDEVNELWSVDLPHEEWDTVGGLVFGLTGRVPLTGETVRFDGIEFKTERVTGRRIQKVLISKGSASEDAADS